MNPLRRLDDALNTITMYRLTVYGLAVLAAAGLVLSSAQIVALPLVSLLLSLVVLLAGCYGANRLLASAWQVGSNTESWLITAFILFLILPPATTSARLAGAVVVAIVAMASKYLLALWDKHVFNPAAIGAVVAGFTGLTHATWWIATPVMLPLTAVVGLVVVRKLRREWLFLAFVSAVLAVMLGLGLRHGHAPLDIFSQAFTSWPLVFFGTVMLTEPATTPPRRRVLYGALVGTLFASQFRFGPLYATPEIVLVAGNLFAYVLSPKYRLRLQLTQKTRLSAHIYDFAFTSDRRPDFRPGQYMEFTLPHAHADSRGNRRIFTIASSPQEDKLHIGVRLYAASSSFKRTLLAMQPGDTVWAGQIAGNFTLPADTTQKLAFVAGGIGVTPFRSMVQHMLDSGERRDIVIFYVVANPQEASYRAVFEQAASRGVRLVTLATAPHAADGADYHSRLTAEIVTRELPDYANRTFYVSGPDGMVQATRRTLRALHIGRQQVVTDNFSGY